MPDPDRIGPDPPDFAVPPIAVGQDMQEALLAIGDELEAAGCPCRCVCHKTGTLTLVKCQCCPHGSKYWSGLEPKQETI